MKRYWFVLIALLSLSACSNEDKEQQLNGELMNLTEQVRTLNDEAASKDSTINELLLTFNEIEENLGAIRDREGNIARHTMDDVELQEDMKTRITAEIQAINQLMADNKAKIAKLYKQLKTKNVKISEFEKLVQRLEAQLNEKDAQIEALRQELATLNIEMEVLYAENEALITQVEDQTAMMNQAFYVFGNSKELKEAGVITKEGGFIGIGRIEKLRSDFNKDYFTEIDMTQTKEVSLNTKKAKLVTTHPEGSYEFLESDGMVTKLVIKDHNEFWSVGKYMVIVVD